MTCAWLPWTTGSRSCSGEDQQAPAHIALRRGKWGPHAFVWMRHQGFGKQPEGAICSPWSRMLGARGFAIGRRSLKFLRVEAAVALD